MLLLPELRRARIWSALSLQYCRKWNRGCPSIQESPEPRMSLCWDYGGPPAPGRPEELQNEHTTGPVQPSPHLALEIPRTSSWNDPMPDHAGPAGPSSDRGHTAFQGDCGFESLCLGLLKAGPPTQAPFFWCISTISHFKLKQNFF